MEHRKRQVELGLTGSSFLLILFMYCKARIGGGNISNTASGVTSHASTFRNRHRLNTVSRDMARHVCVAECM